MWNAAFCIRTWTPITTASSLDRAWILHLPTWRVFYKVRLQRPVLCPLWGCCWGCWHPSHTPRTDVLITAHFQYPCGSHEHVRGESFLCWLLKSFQAKLLCRFQPGQTDGCMLLCTSFTGGLTNLFLFFLVPCCSHFLFYIFIGKYTWNLPF